MTVIQEKIYIDNEIKEKAKSLFQKYNLTLNEAINLFLSKTVEEKNLPFILNKTDNELKIETIDSNDPDYKLVEKTRGEETISLKEFMSIWM